MRAGLHAAMAGLLLAVGLVAPVVPASATGTSAYPRAVVSVPTEPGAHGRAFGTSLVDLAPWGYSEKEFFVSGIATSGGATYVAPFDGSSFAPAAYRSRILVRQPPKQRFNGTVVVEWLNVTSGSDLDVEWIEHYREVLRGGYAYVGVTVQSAGVSALRNWDSARYGTLSHPGDTYAHSIYGQVLATLRNPNGVDPLGELSARKLIADGHSQSSLYMQVFLTDVQAPYHLADGVLIRGATRTAFDPDKVRTPVLQYQSESEIYGAIDVGAENPTYFVKPTPFPPDSTYFRLWQVAGAAHVSRASNAYQRYVLNRDQAGQPATWKEDVELVYDGTAGTAVCPTPAGLGPMDGYPQWAALDAALHQLNRWVVTGKAPASAPRVVLASSGAPQRDGHGNAIGGVRNPTVDVPVATYRGEDGCGLWGSTKKLDAATLHSLYPSPSAYVEGFGTAAERAVAAGWLLPYDADYLLGLAARVAL